MLMQAETSNNRFSDEVGKVLPFLRRYARALTGSQKSGDNYAIATLDAILRDRTPVLEAETIKEGLFRCFHAIWVSTGRQLTADEEGDDVFQRAQAHLSKLTANTREVLLLNTIEEFPIDAIARIIDTDEEEVAALLDRAIEDIAASSSGKIMIIEDEPIIAEDLQDIVTDLGHRVIGIARTRDEARELAASERPQLVLADIQLADNSSGIDAVNDLLTSGIDVPVIFITAFPERLLTGDKPEPAFLITKPFTVSQVRSAVSQAMFFSSTATLQRA